MFERLKKKITSTQPRFFVIAVFLAWILWFVTMNYFDPVTHYNFNLELHILNEDALTDRSRLILNSRELENMLVNVHVTGLKSELDNLVANENIRAYIDINTSEIIFVPTNELIPVRTGVFFGNPAQTESLQITSIHPAIVDIEIDRLVTRLFDINLIFDPEELPEGYITLPPELEPRRVSITGPSTIVTQISANMVGARVDVSGARDDIFGVDVSIVAYNEFDDVITGFAIDEEYLNFRLPILRTHMAGIQMGEPIGEMPTDVAIKDILWEPREIELVGHVDEEHVDVILDNIDITGISETTTILVDINDYLDRINAEVDAAFALKNPLENIIEVTFVTEPIITREYIIERDSIPISGEALRREILTESISVSLRGPASVLEEIDEVLILVDAGVLADRPDGEYTLPVEIILPQGTEVYGQTPSVTIRLTTPEPADEEADDA